MLMITCTISSIKSNSMVSSRTYQRAIADVYDPKSVGKPPDPVRRSPDLAPSLFIGSTTTSSSPYKPDIFNLNDDHDNSVHDDREGEETCRWLQGTTAHVKAEEERWWLMEKEQWWW